MGLFEIIRLSSMIIIILILKHLCVCDRKFSTIVMKVMNMDLVTFKDKTIKIAIN